MSGEHDPAGVVGVNLGFGVNGFVGSETRGVIGPGVGWEVRVSTLDNRHVRAELAYLGSTQDMADGSDVRLTANGIQGTLRINVVPTWPVEPFFYVGVGWSRFSVTDNEGTNFTSPDNVLDTPFGLGAAYHVGRFVFDVRAAVSVITGGQLVPAMMEGDSIPSMNRFSVRASVGVEL